MDRPQLDEPETAADSEAVPPAATDDWVHELVAFTRPGAEIEFPVRDIAARPIPLIYDDFD
jgi:hypothetical protein